MKRMLIWCAGGILVLSGGTAMGATYPDTILNQGPTAYYRFNDGLISTPPDPATNSGSLGVLGNGSYFLAVHPVPGALVGSADTAARVSGGQSMRVPLQVLLNPVPPFSVEAWLNPAAIVSGQTLTTPLASHSSSPRAGWILHQTASGWNFRLHHVSGPPTAASITGGTPTVGAWHHVVATYSGTTVILYVNGAQVATAAAASYTANTTTPLTLGVRSDGTLPWSGDADEVAVYNSALSAAQVLAHYQNGTNSARAVGYEQVVLADAPTGYWRLNEPSALPIAANSGTGGAAINGVYQGGATNTTQAPRPPQYFGFESDNTSVHLDGTNDYVRTVTGLLDNQPNITLSGWIRRGGTQLDRTGLFGQNDLVEFGYIDNNTIQAWVDFFEDHVDVTPNPFPNLTWNHLALVANSGQLSVYTNSRLAGAVTLPASTYGTSPFPFNIGGGGIFDNVAFNGNWFLGQIDEVAVFNKALTPEQICAQYFSTVQGGPSIERQPQSTNVFEGDTVTLSVGACGTPILHYQWLLFGDPLQDETNATLVLDNLILEETGTYSVVVDNAFGSLESAGAEVVVMPATKPVILRDPASLARYVGAPKATFSVVATGGVGLQYQWLRDGEPIPNETNSTLMIAPVQSSDAAGYRVVVSNASGSTTSAEARLTLITPGSGSYEAAVLDHAPLAYWRLGETSGTAAFDYWGGYDGVYNAGVTLGAGGALVGNADTAAQFDGTSGFVSTPFSLNGLGAFSLLGWIRRGGAQADFSGFFGQNDLIEFGYVDNNTIQAWVDNFVNHVDVTPNPIPDQQWGQVAAVVNFGTLEVFVNGSKAGEATLGSTNYGANNYKFMIAGGGIFSASGNFFLGRVDDVAVYDRALTEDELCSLYLLGTGVPVTLSIALGGNIVPDTKPLGTLHHGASHGAVWAASSTDGAAVTRNGVMSFSAVYGDQITVAADPDFNGTQGSVLFWMRSAGAVGAGDFGAMLFDRRTSTGDVIVQQDDGHLFVQASGGSIVNSFSSTGTVSDNRWHHIAYVFDQGVGGSITLYIDGAPSGSQANSGAWSWPPNHHLELGRSHDPFWRRFTGLLDDVRFYNRMLTPSEVAQVAASDALVDTGALKLRLNFDAAPSGVTVTWPCGTLESATELIGNGPGTVWTPLPDATPPYVILPAGDAKFFRVRR